MKHVHNFNDIDWTLCHNTVLWLQQMIASAYVAKDKKIDGQRVKRHSI